MKLMLQRRGFMFVLSSPSGAGKTTLANHLLDIESNLSLSISATTRAKRPNEIDGKDYIFLSQQDFMHRREQGEFLEWAKVFDNFYATPRGFVEDALQNGRDILFDIDWQGRNQLAELLPDDLVSVFILPPSAQSLEQRLRSRAQDTEATVKRRMAGAANEIKHWDCYDYIVINNEVEQSLAEIQAILQAERLKRTRRHGLINFVERLQNDLDNLSYQ